MTQALYAHMNNKIKKKKKKEGPSSLNPSSIWGLFLKIPHNKLSAIQFMEDTKPKPYKTQILYLRRFRSSRLDR
jgi:hypothetical protein